MAEVRTQKKGQTTYAELYFPGGLSMAEASPIHLAAGEELNGIDFRIIKVKSFSIFGRLLGGSGSASSFVQLMPLDDTNGSVSWNASQMAQVDSDGKFAFHECRPGRFALTARSFSDDNHASAHAEVSIADSDVNVSLEFGQNPDLQGSIRSDDPNETLKPGISVFLRPEANGPFFGMPAETREDGTFTLKSVSLERVRVSIQPIPDGHYIKSIQLGNVQAEDDALDLTNGAPGELVITLGSKGATVTGTVQDDQQKILTNARIVLVPDNRKLESHFETGSPDQNGQFSIKNVPPGSYKLFAFDNAEFGSWLDPEWLKPYDSKGEAIEVKESEKVTKGLTLIKTGDL